MPTNATIPHPVVVPATGAPTCAGVDLVSRFSLHLHNEAYAALRALALGWYRDGYLLCLRPTVDRPACVGLSPTQFADASLQPDFAARALVVDPYDAEGNDIREYPAVVSGHVQQAVRVAEECGAVDLSTRVGPGPTWGCGRTCGCVRCTSWWADRYCPESLHEVFAPVVDKATIQERAVQGDALARAAIDPPRTITWSAERHVAAWERHDAQEYMGRST